MYKQTNIPDIFQYNDYNPTLFSSNAEFDLPFAQTKESLLDAELYKNFLQNAISRFRHSRTYKHYKAHLMQLGLNRCQVYSNISSSEDANMATIEMHHNILTIFDVALIIAEHMLNVQGAITTFDICELLKNEHINHRVCTVMLSKTAHQKVHNDKNFIIPPSMCFGDWVSFLSLYRTGITRDIAFKLIYYLDKCIHSNNQLSDVTKKQLELRDWIIQWSDYNNNATVITSDITD